MQQKFWSWLVFAVSIGAYVPLAIGEWHHPIEFNVASYSLWMLLNAASAYSLFVQKFSGWRMPLGWFLGDMFLILLAIALGGYTFNLGEYERVILYGIVGIFALWMSLGAVQKRWNPRILHLGNIVVFALTYYPIIKQYAHVHEPMTAWSLSGWALYLVGAGVNLFVAEQFFTKLWMQPDLFKNAFQKEKNLWDIGEESLFSLVNTILIGVVIVLVVI